MASNEGGGKARKGGGGGRPKKPSGHTPQPAIQATSTLQALLLADSFDESFRPVTLELPRCLLPVLNVPLINYTIESLAGSGVDEIFVLCCAHSEKIERYIETLQTNNVFPDVSLKCIVSKQSTSVGDALREMYQLALLREDFILVHGDVITTINIQALYDRHVERRNKDKQVIMTVVLSPLRPTDMDGLGGRGTGIGGTATTKSNASVGDHRSSLLTASISSVDEGSLASSSQDLPMPKNLSASNASCRAKSMVRDASDDEDKGDDEDFSGKDSKLSSLIGRTFGLGGDYSSDEDGNHDGSVEEEDEEICDNGTRLHDSVNRRIVAVDAETGQLLMYKTEAHVQQRWRGKELQPNDKDPALEIDVAVFEQHPRLVFRDDVEDAGIVICSSDVLSQFTDNFDYQTVPRLIRGIVDEEVLSCKVFVHVESSTYSRRVSSLRHYQQVSLDILRRWTYPFVPDNNLTWGCTVSFLREHPHSHQGTGSNKDAALPTVVVVPSPTSFSYTRDTKGRSGFYKEKNVSLSRSALVGGGDLTDVETVVGQGTTVGPNSRIVASVIGRNCKIGDHVVIRNSFLWDGVAIGDNAEINSSLLCSGASVGAGSKLAGVILSFNVDVPERVMVPTLAKLTTVADHPLGLYNDPEPIDWNLWRSMLDSIGSSAEVVSGVNAKVRQWAYPPVPHNELVSGSDAVLLSSSASERPKWSVQGMGASVVPGARTKPLHSAVASVPSDDSQAPNPRQTSPPKTSVDDFEDGYSDDDDQPTEGDGSYHGASFGFDSTSSSAGSRNALGGDDDDDSLSDIQKFRNEVVKTVVRRMGEKSKIDDLRVEINSLKFAFNESFVESSSCIFAGLMSTIPSTATSVRQSVKSVLASWGSIFRNFLGEVNDQTEFIFCIQQFCEEDGNECFVKAFELSLHTLYDMDVLSEQAILAWAAEVKAGSGDDLKFLALCRNLLQWLQEADEE